MQVVNKLELADLRPFWAYQVDRIQRADRYNWLPEMRPVALKLKQLAEQRMDEAGIPWDIRIKK